jgi:hypothetical protein
MDYDIRLALSGGARLRLGDSVEEDDALLKAMPLGAANLLTFELMPVGPLTPLGMLPDGHQAAA